LLAFSTPCGCVADGVGALGATPFRMVGATGGTVGAAMAAGGAGGITAAAGAGAGAASARGMLLPAPVLVPDTLEIGSRRNWPE